MKSLPMKEKLGRRQQLIKNLADGSYLYKAIVTDLAGNTSETGVEKLIIDNSLNIESTTVTVKPITEDNTISLVEKIKLFL